ncbi:MAG: hypothetical protein GX345_07675 [Clostridiales bacterium]|nr:hypothetical protein [Clostridiales bacterium]
MAKNDNRSKSEIYREERKERLAKAAKARAKNAGKTAKAQKLVQKTLSIALVLAIAFFAVWNVLSMTGTVEKAVTVMTVGNSKVSARDYNYYYILTYNYTVGQARQFEQQYGQNIMGFETGISPDEQAYPQADEDSDIKTWADYLSRSALDRAQQYEALYKEAISLDKAKYSLTEEEREELNEQMEELRESAAKQSFSLNAYLRASYGKGVNEKFLRKQLEKESIVARFNEDKLEEFKDALTDDKIEALYKEARDEYDVMSLRIFSIRTPMLDAKEDETEEQFADRQKAEAKKAKEKADAMLATVSDNASFVEAAKENKELMEGEIYDADEDTMQFHKTKAAVSQKANEDAADWAFAKDRLVGDKKVFQDEDGDCHVLLVTALKAPPIKVDVRHVLVSFLDENSESEEPTDEEKANAKSKAEKLYKEWQEGDKSEDSFAELAKSDSGDPGSAENGGLYEDVAIGSMVAPFENWCFDSTKKPGDSGIVETSYGYHLMYMVKNDANNFQYIDDIRENKSVEDIEEYLEGLLDKDDYAMNEKDKAIAWAQKNTLKIIKKMIRMYQ